ncbi:hypothetical protein BCON_0076g00260 [Botryotinia convoluta]|uniref:Uncharacterized protein n=1 Tax=Botryotinia convoluta TaxID=54673 RepID=A0A4Z1I4M7_9HELO|nr:hypothetical protein BCON_0076g00260 [Botryotinia convoluta]
MSNQQNRAVKQYDRNGRELDPQSFHNFNQMHGSVRFDPKARHEEIRSGRFPEQIRKDKDYARQIEEGQRREQAVMKQRQRDYEQTQQAGGSSSAGGKGKEVQKHYDPIRDEENRR